MSYLEPFTTEQRALLAALPYRVGLLVSESDSTGGEEADEAEMRTLESLLVGFAEDCCKSEFVEELLKETLSHRENWERWQKNVKAVPDECRQALDALDAHFSVQEVHYFKSALMDIALNVALSYQEIDYTEGHLSVWMLYARYFKEWVSAKLEKRTPLTLDQLSNISDAEQEVLEELASILGITLNESDDSV